MILTKDREAPIIQTLDSSRGAFQQPDGTNCHQQSGLNAFNSGLLDAGNYHLIFGVFDLEGTDKSSALLVDNIWVDLTPSPQAFPEPVPLFGVYVAFGLAGLSKKLQRKSKV